MARASGVQRVDFAVPFGERIFLVVGQARGVVGDVVDLAAERIDRVHRVAAVLR